MNKRRRVVLLTLLITIIMLMGLGTYAFFTADVEGNVRNDNIVQNTGTLQIEYIEGQSINDDKIIPGWTGTKTFTVKNTGTLSANYDIVFADLINTFINDEILFSGTCTSSQSTCENIEQGVVDAEDFFIKQNITIEPEEEHSYEIKIEFIETGSNQNYNKAAELSGKIAIYETGNYTLASNIEVDIVDNMIPVSWDGSTLIKADKSNTNNNWYDYDNQKWANVVLVTNDSRENYKTSNQGTEIIEDDILAYYTYIPRYRYQLWNANNNEDCLMDNCNEQEIQIRFETKNSTKAIGNENAEWLTHPAFTFGDSELNGIWVGKFTTSADPSTSCYTTPSAANCNKKDITPIIKPNMDMWRYTQVSTMFSVTKQIETNSMYGLSNESSIDSHMLKNMEWGAVAYLSHSKYGKYGNEDYTGTNKQLYINNYRVDAQAYKTETGCSGGAPSTAQNSSSCPHPYPGLTTEALGASTTGNIYGIYDMSGGVWEYVMGQIVQSVGTPLGIFHANSSSGTWDTMPQNKYYDSYTYDKNELSHGRGQLGDATRETLKTFGTNPGGWYGDRSCFPYSTSVWFVRGGDAHDGSQAGAFAFDRGTGGAYYYSGFRVLLALE